MSHSTRRDFLRALGIGAFACAVHNVPKVLTSHTTSFEFEDPPTLVGDILITQDGAELYRGPCKVVPPGNHMTMHGVQFSVAEFDKPVQCVEGDVIKVRYTLHDSLPEKWALESLRILEESMSSARLVHRDFTDALGKASGALHNFGEAARQCADVIS